jgi:2-amino-4-hydroxy-6-hydroxymethyldihydropteridine diphosphokinase
MYNKVVLLTGSNLGDRMDYLNFALYEIEKNVGNIVKQSEVYESSAWGKTNQGDFLNQALIIETKLNAQEVLLAIQNIENQAKRTRNEKWGERTLDIDILFFNHDIIQTDNLKVPHPYIEERLFTLAPLCEIMPQYEHPVSGKTIEQLYHSCDKSLKVSIYP